MTGGVFINMLVSPSAILRQSLIVLCFASIPAYAAKENNIQKILERANTESSNGGHAKAKKIVSKVLKRYPKNLQAKFLLGQIYFREGDRKSAAKILKTIKLDKITIEGVSAFDYGMVFYLEDDCKRSFQGFDRVQKNNTFYNYSMFYAGVCSYKLGRYRKTIKYLNAAQNLPNSYEPTRRDMLDQSYARLKREESGVQNLQNPIILVPTQVPQTTSAQTVAPVTGEEKPKEPEKSPFSLAINPNASLIISETNEDYGGTRSKSIRSQTTTLGLKFLTRYDSKETKSGKNSLTLDFSGLRTTLKTSTDDLRFFWNEESNLGQEQTTAKLDTDYSYFQATPGLNFIFSNGFDLGLSYSIAETYPEFRRDNKLGTKTATLSMRKSKEGSNLGVKSNYTNSYNAKEKTQTTVSVESTNSFNFSWADLTINGSFAKNTQEKAYVLSSTPLSQAKGNLGLSKTFEILTIALQGEYLKNVPNTGFDYVNLSSLETMKGGATISISYADFLLSGQGEYLNQKNYSIFGISIGDTTKPLTATGVASGDQYNLVASLSYKALTWLSIGGKYQYLVSELVAHNLIDQNGNEVIADYSANFYQALPSTQATSTFNVGVNYTF